MFQEDYMALPDLREVANGYLRAEVRFKNNGLDLVEVQDNGSGISPENYENVGELDTTDTAAL